MVADRCVNTLLKTIFKNNYSFILSLLVSNIDKIIIILKSKMPIYGEVLEYLYYSLPDNYDDRSIEVLYEYEYVDNIVRTLFKKISPIDKKRTYINDVNEISDMFHISSVEFEFYYFVALLIIAIESDCNLNAFSLYMQLSEPTRNFTNIQKEKLFESLTQEEINVLIYNQIDSTQSH